MINLSSITLGHMTMVTPHTQAYTIIMTLCLQGPIVIQSVYHDCYSSHQDTLPQSYLYIIRNPTTIQANIFVILLKALLTHNSAVSDGDNGCDNGHFTSLLGPIRWIKLL